MSLLRKIAAGLRALFHKPQVEKELDDEVRAYLDASTEAKIAAGMPREQALRAARMELGSVEAVKEDVRAAGWESFLETIWQDLRFATRMLRKSPGFTAVAVLTLALGIGATTAVFSAVDRILFRALPYANENQLVSVGMMAPLDTNEFLFADPYFALRRDPGPFEEVSAFEAGSFATDLTQDNPARLSALRIESNFLELFGVSPLLGRSFTREEDRPGGPGVAMISYGLWRSRFGGDPRAVGRTLTLDGASVVQIVGVLPRDFEMPTLTRADIFLPLALNEATEHSGRALRAFARVKPGISVPQAMAQLQPEFQRWLETVPPEYRREVSLRVRPVRDRQVGDARVASLALFGGVLAVLLMACANLASLLLARAVAREREFAVRSALGASRLRLMRQALTESLMLSFVGGALGCGLAWALLRIFIAMAPAALPRLNEATIDTRVLFFALGASLVSGLLFGAAPALRRSGSLLVGNVRSTPVSRGGLRSALVMLEMAFSIVLLAGAGLLLRSLWKLESVPLGLQPDHVLTARFVLGRQRYDRDDQQLTFFNELESRLAADPGVESAAITDSLPPAGGMRGRPLASIDVEGQPRRPEGTGGMVGWRYVTPGYFAALGIPIVRGRGFIGQDREPAAFVAILSESLARAMFPHEDPIGKKILPQGPQGQEPPREWTTVIGIARDVTNLGATRESWPEYYIVRKPAADYNFQNQEPPTGWRSAVVVARTAIDPNLVAGSIRRIIASLDPTLPVEMETMQQRLAEIDQGPRFYALLLAAFAGMGALLAAIGIYGVISFLAAQRTHEIGIRMALGAQRNDVLKMMLGGGARLAVVGVGIGVIGALASTRLLSSLLFGVRPADPATFAAVALGLLAVALLACYIPARRATRVDPMVALRHE